MSLETELLLLTATEGEGEHLLRYAESVERVSRSTGVVLRGRLGGVPVRWAAAGLGSVNTAIALTRELEAERPGAVLQFGIGGAFVPSGLEVGDVVLASEEIYGDLGVITPEGWHGAECIGIPLVPGEPPRFNRFPLDRALVARAAAACGARTGSFVTLSQCTGCNRVAGELWHRWAALCENMEGAAAAHVCALYAVPFLEVRGISNRVEDRNRESWQIGPAVRAASEAALRIVQHLGPSLVAVAPASSAI